MFINEFINVGWLPCVASAKSHVWRCMTMAPYGCGACAGGGAHGTGLIEREKEQHESDQTSCGVRAKIRSGSFHVVSVAQVFFKSLTVSSSG